MEQTRRPLSIFNAADLGLIVEHLIKSPPRIRPGAAALLSLAAVSMGLLGDALFYSTLPGINIPIWHTTLLAVLIVAARPCGIKLERRVVALMAISLVFSSLVAWRGSPFLQALNLGSAALTMLLAIALPPRLGSRRMGFVTFLFALAAGSPQAVQRALSSSPCICTTRCEPARS